MSILEQPYYHGEISIETAYSLLKNPGDFLVLYDPCFVESLDGHPPGAFFMIVKYEDPNDLKPFWKFRFGNIKKPWDVVNMVNQYLATKSLLVEVCIKLLNYIFLRILRSLLKLQ